MTWVSGRDHDGPNTVDFHPHSHGDGTVFVIGPEKADTGLPMAEPEQTFGEKAVGLTFNPSGDDAVHKCKAGFAALIDQMDAVRHGSVGERARLASIAITEAQSAQMWAVKALTWRD